jgi:transposase
MLSEISGGRACRVYTEHRATAHIFSLVVATIAPSLSGKLTRPAPYTSRREMTVSALELSAAAVHFLPRCVVRLLAPAAEEWALLDELEKHIEAMEERIRQRIGSLGWVRLLKTLPGVGTILGSAIYLEIGEVSRFETAASLASYAGLVPTVHASGGKSWQGPTPRSANHFLKWAFVEAANVIATRQKAWADKHVVKLYQRLKSNKCHGKATTAVARHLAESSWWILTKKQPYRDPALGTMSSSKNG